MDYNWPGSSVHGIFPDKKTGMGCHFLLQGVFPTQGSNTRFLFGKQILYHLTTREAQVLKYILMYGCENRTKNKTEHWRIDAFVLWCWRRLLRVPWTSRRSNQTILKEIGPEYSLEWLMLKLKLQYFGHLIRRADSFEKTPMLGKIEGRRGDDRGWDGWRASLTQWIWVWVNSGS